MGATLIEVNVAPVTVSVAVPDWPPNVAVMTLVPTPTAVTNPGVELDSVAVAMVPDVHVASELGLVSWQAG